MGLSLVTTCNCHSYHPFPFSCPPPLSCIRKLMQCSSGAVAKVICIQSRSWQMTWQFSVQTVWLKEGGEGKEKGVKTHLPCKPQAESPKSSSATAQLITEANREHLRVVASSTASPQSGRAGAWQVWDGGVVKEICAMPSATPCSSRRSSRSHSHSRRKHVAWQSHCTTQSGASLCCASSSRICMQMVG